MDNLLGKLVNNILEDGTKENNMEKEFWLMKDKGKKVYGIMGEWLNQNDYYYYYSIINYLLLIL